MNVKRLFVPASRVRALRRDIGLLLRRRREGMRLLQAVRIASAPREFLARQQQARRLLAGRSVRLRVDPKLGYRRLEPGELAELPQMLELALDLRRRRTPILDHITQARAGKHRILFDLLSDVELEREPRWADFAMSDPIVESAVDYLVTIPVLHRIALGLSVPATPAQALQHSQLLHFDGEDFAQYKLMVNVSDVGPDDGPFSCFPAHVSGRITQALGFDVLRRIRSQSAGGDTTTPRFLDEEAYRFAEHKELVELIGPPGTAMLVDTSRCLHFGSRIRSGRQRLLLAVVFQRFHNVNPSPSNFLDSQRFAGDSLRTRLLARRQAVAPGTFYPEPSLETPGPKYALGS